MGGGRGASAALGAEVVEVDFPVIERYEGDRPGGENVDRLGVLPEGWMDTEFTHFLAFGWDDFLRANGDPGIPSLAGVDPDRIFPHPLGSLPDRYEEVADYEDRYRGTVALARTGIPDPRERADFADGLRALVRLREELFEDWLHERGLDGVVFPANADVGAADADVNRAAADRAWANGVLFSNGNYALRHLGIPTVTVAMGTMEDIGMPVGLTFAGAAYSDRDLLRYAGAFEAAGSLRTCPPFAPPLPEDRIAATGPDGPAAVTLEAELDGEHYHEGAQRLTLSGTFSGPGLRVYVNGQPVAVDTDGERWTATAILPPVVEPPRVGGNPRASRALVVALAGRSAGAFAELA